MNPQNPARPIALLILLILTIGSGFSLFASLAGNTHFGAITCAGSIGLSAFVLIFGGLVIGSNRSNDDSES